MASKGFICEVDLNLHLLSTLGNYDCPSHYIYLTVEIFGKVHQTKPQHSYYPLILNETVQSEKTFWSSSNKDEVLDKLEDTPVIIELRRIDPCSYNGVLLAYYDGSAKDFLFSRYPRIPCSTNGREVYLNRTIDFKGTTPRLRYSALADIKRLGGGDIEDSSIEKYNSSYNREDDGYYSPTHSPKESIYKQLSRQSSSPKRSASPTANESVSAPYYSRQTVASAIRSRSPSPIGNRSGDNYDDKNYGMTGDTVHGAEKTKEPFVVRKVPDTLIQRTPKLHDSLPRDSGRQGRLKRRPSLTKNQEMTSSLPSAGRRFRSASPTKRIDIDDKLDSYKPSTYTSRFRSHFDSHHSCYACRDYCHSPLIDYYSQRLARLNLYSGTPYSCHSHCCCW